MRVAAEIVLTDEERSELKKPARSKRTSVRLAHARASCCLPLTECRTRTSPRSWGWAECSFTLGVSAMPNPGYGIERDLPRGAPRMKIDVARLMELTTQSKPEQRPRTGARARWRPTGRQRGECLAPLARPWPEAAHRQRLQGLA